MELTKIQRELSTLSDKIVLRFNEPMSEHTSFRIGGPAEVMAFPRTAEELAEILKVSALLDINPAILGAGTNILAPDAGVPGLVIRLKDALTQMYQMDDTHIYVSSGVSMTKAAVFAASLGLSGLEFAHGIPGSVGGGVFMNAGAYGGEVSAVCAQVDIMSFDGVVGRIESKDMGFSYRHSRLEEEHGIVLGAVFSLQKKNPEEIQAYMRELMQKRKASQPLEYPSAGSAFKRPATGYAAAMIDQSSLKGFRVGNAAVSEKHAGFIINLGGATANDVNGVITGVRQKVFEKFGVMLAPEIRIW